MVIFKAHHPTGPTDAAVPERPFLQPDRALHDLHDATANPDAGDDRAPALNVDEDSARAPQFIPLLILDMDHRTIATDDTIMHQISAERPAGTAGRGIFELSGHRRKEPGMDVGARSGGVPGKDLKAMRVIALTDGAQRSQIQGDGLHGLQRVHRHHELWQTSADELRREAGCQNILWIKTQP